MEGLEEQHLESGQEVSGVTDARGLTLDTRPFFQVEARSARVKGPGDEASGWTRPAR